MIGQRAAAKLRLATLLCAALLPMAAGAQWHVHGVATLNLTLTGNALAAAFVIPAVDVVGFEQIPSTPEAREHIEQAMEQLGQARNMLSPPAAAGCKATSSSVETTLREKSHSPPRRGNWYGYREPDEAHGEFHVRHSFECRHPDRLTRIFVPLFAQLPRLQRIDVHSAIPAGRRTQHVLSRIPFIILP